MEETKDSQNIQIIGQDYENTDIKEIDLESLNPDDEEVDEELDEEEDGDDEDDEDDGYHEEDDDEEDDEDEDKDEENKSDDEEQTSKKVIKHLESILASQPNIETQETEEFDDDTDDDDYLEKFDNDIKDDIIKKYHPELVQSNYDEISALTKVIRDEQGNIIDPLHNTIPFLTKFERARILGVRAKQINNGAEPFIQVPDNVIEGHIIAELELQKRVLPFIIVRPLPNGKKEYWRIQDLKLIDY